MPDSPLLQVRAALVRAGPGATATGWSACVLLGLDVARGPRPVEISADRRGRDIDRLDALRRDGWIVIVVTAPQLARPHWVTDRAREALTSRGWVAGPNEWASVLAENAAENARTR